MRERRVLCRVSCFPGHEGWSWRVEFKFRNSFNAKTQAKHSVIVCFPRPGELQRFWECSISAMASFQKHPSFGDLVHKFSQACMLRPGAKYFDAAIPATTAQFQEVMNGPSKDPRNERQQVPHKDLKEEGEELFHEAESYPLEESDKLSQRVQALVSLINETFATVSSLKSAYIKLQAAHSPYDPEMLRIADKSVILELKRLSELKHSVWEKQAFSRLTASQGKSFDLEYRELMMKKIQELEDALIQQQKNLTAHEGYIEKYRKEIEEKNAEIGKLKSSLEKSIAKKDKLEKRLKKLEHKSTKDQISNGLSSQPSTKPQLFELIVQEAKDATSKFAKLLMALMKSAHWDLDAAASAIEPGVIYSKPAHKKYSFESYVCHRIFSGFENENFYMSGSLSSILDPEKHKHECLLQFQDMRSIDPLELVSITPDCLFGKFCHKKYLQIVHAKMEESFFGHFQHRDQILNGVHPRSKFYQSFLKFAKAVWLVHRLAFSFSPTVKIFQVRKDVEFHPLYMESVILDAELGNDDPNVQQRVALTITPGFHTEDEVLKCRIYPYDLQTGDFTKQNSELM